MKIITENLEEYLISATTLPNKPDVCVEVNTNDYLQLVPIEEFLDDIIQDALRDNITALVTSYSIWRLYEHSLGGRIPYITMPIGARMVTAIEGYKKVPVIFKEDT